MILASRLSSFCRTNKHPIKIMWSVGSGDSVSLGKSRHFPVLCKQCVQHFSRTVQSSVYKCPVFSRVFLSSVRPVFRCFNRGTSTTSRSKINKSFQENTGAINSAKISNQEFKRLLGLAKPERWKLTGECDLQIRLN